MGRVQLYYQIVPKAINDTGHENSISGTVKLRTADVISHTNGKFEEIPLEGAHIIAGGKETSTDKDGHWTITSSEFDVNETYPVIAEYGGKNYTGYAMVNKDTQASNIVIDEYNTFDVVDFKAARVENKSQYVNTEDWKITSIDSCAVSNEDKRQIYSFKINELNKGTATVGKVEVYRYDSTGALKDTYTAVYNDSTRQYEIKKPSLIGTDNYNYSINPATEKVGAGDYLAIRVYDRNNVGYIEHNVGMIFKPRLSVLTVVNSFKSPFNGVIEFMNKMDTSLDLGFTQKLDDLAESKGDVTVTEDERTISFGWNKEFKKSYDSSKKKEDKDDKGEKKEAPDTPVEEIKESAKKLEEVSGGDDKSEEDEKIKNEAKDTASNAVDKNSNDNKKNGKTNADLKFTLSVGVSIVMGYDKAANKYYFKDLVVTGVVDGEASATYKYTTPVGIAIMVKGELSGDITAMMVTEPFYKNPDKPDYLYMSDEDNKIDLNKLGSSDVDRKLSIYGKLMLRPKVTLSAGASFVKLASLTLSGSADFDMVFTTANAGKGSVTLSSELVLGLIGDKIKKKWLITKKKYDMFNINGTSVASLMNDGDYRYDVITEEDVDEQLYLNNRSYNFGETNAVSLADVSVDHYNEQILETGAFPSAQPLIEVISYGTASAGSDTSMIMLFLDSDENGTVLKYSICENNVWSQPQLVDNDGADDDTVHIYDLGDRFIITWSSEAPGVDKTDFVTRFNSRNIRAVFFDKASKTFGDIMEVTKTTDGDVCADDSAAVADYTALDGTRKLLMTYVKSLYEQVNSDELMVGDVVNPYSTIAYRFYDFETNTWTEEYSEKDINNLSLAMSSDEVELYAENWYGQGFMDLSKYVDIDDSSMIISEDDEELGHMAGRWSRQPESSEISIKSMNSDPQAVEHKTITCGKYAVSAYAIDLDKEAATTEDREIFLQMYDVVQDKFYPLIRLTNDAVSQQNIIFDETPEGVMLYYISDGDIVSFNITDMIARALYKTTAADGTEVLINSNCYTGYTDPCAIVEAEEDNPLTEFTVNAADDAVLVTWSQNGISYKEGIDPTSSEATEPENYYKERQMYTVMETFENFEEPYYDEDGSIATYPYTDDDGIVIDYNLEPDVNGQFGVVSAGDEMIRRGKTVTWTKPVKITEEQGENFTNIDCVIVAPKLLRMVYLKGLSTVKDISGTMMPVEDTDNRSLIVSDFDFRYEMLDGVIVNGDDVYAGQENLHIDVDVTNEAIWEMSDIEVKLYQQPKDGEKTLIGTETINKLVGGNTKRVSITWNVPQSLDGLRLMAEVEQNGFVFSEDEWEYEDDIQIVIDNISHKMLDRNTARLQISVSNNGSENAENENVYVNLNGTETSSESFALLSGEKKVITMDVDVPAAAFEDTSDEEKISETAGLRIYTQFDVHDYEITRSADKSLAELMNEAKIQNAETGETYTDKISVKQKDIVVLNAVSDDNNTLDMKISNYDSENVKAVNNMISPQNSGDTSVSIDIYPDIDTYVTNNMDNMELANTYLDLPSSLIKTVNMTVSTSAKKTSGGSGGGSSSANPTPTPVPVSTMSPSETVAPSKDAELPFTDVKTSDWFYDNVRYAYENKLFSGVSDTLFAPDEPMTRAMLVTVLYRAEGEPDMNEEIWGYPFEDVDAESWYGAAVYWARNRDIVQGYSEDKFAPDAPVTREQIAAILYRYAEFKGIRTKEIGDLSPFTDAESISKWAQNDVGWAIGKGLLTGRGNGVLDPIGNATRAEVAAILQRFNESSVVSHESKVTKTADINKVVSADEEKAAEIAAALYDYFGTEDAETGNPYIFEIVGEFDADNEHYYLGRWQWNVEGHNSLLCDFVLKESLTEMYDCTIKDNKIDWFEADSVIK
ncbi:MAG: S-layer homology domain-containing protein [Candidatus Ornithomonoglobus sp.]